MTAAKFTHILTGGTVLSRPARYTPRAAARVGDFFPLTPGNLARACRLCLESAAKIGCDLKVEWVREISRYLPGEILGFASVQDGQVVGAVEFLPASLVPYPLPTKKPHIAFITCIYSLPEKLDYRGAVLTHLLQNLGDLNYYQVQVIAGAQLPYPNGPETFFKSYGFHRLACLGRVALTDGEDELVLMGRDTRDPSL